MRSGGTPNFAVTPASSSASPLMVLNHSTSALTNWVKSLSPVAITVRQPACCARSANVPITSSASTPSCITTGQPSARTACSIGSICATKSSGIFARFALYSGYQSSRKVLPFASKTHTACSVGTMWRRRLSIAIMPYSAPVGSPVGLRKSGRP